MEPGRKSGGDDPGGPSGPDTPASPRRRLDVLPLLLLLVIGLVLLGGLWLFPLLHSEIAFQDCTATGRTDCGGIPAH